MNKQKLSVLPFLVLLLPFDLFVGLALLVSEAIRRGLSVGSVTGNSLRPINPHSVTVIVLNWDGRHLLEESLPVLIDAVGDRAGILVVDNGSRDGSVEFVRQRFPRVRVLALDRNLGFTSGNNQGVDAVETDIIVFLNNDMIVDRGFLQPLLDCFSDPSVFAVTSQIFFPDPCAYRSETGNTHARFERGFFSLAHKTVETSEVVPVFWAGGGSSAVDRAKFVELGGFDSLYHPFYVEDLDLSYQAWKRGWKSLLAPSSSVVHKHRGTSRPKFGDAFVDNTIRRNLYLCIWKNVTDMSMLLNHIVNLPRIHGQAMLHWGARVEIQAFFRALTRLPHALLKRIKNHSRYVLSDRDVLNRIPKA